MEQSERQKEKPDFWGSYGFALFAGIGFGLGTESVGVGIGVTTGISAFVKLAEMVVWYTRS
jgi:hypothetical protein